MSLIRIEMLWQEVFGKRKNNECPRKELKIFNKKRVLLQKHFVILHLLVELAFLFY